MKRLKSLLPLVVAMVLTVSIMIGSFGVFAFAATNLPTEGKAFFDNTKNTNIVTRVKEGEDFDIPVPLVADGVSVKVADPVGIKIDPIAPATPYTFTAAQLGNYTVTYSAENGKYSYSYNVLSYEDREYFMYVKETAEDFIPTYVQKGAVIKLPAYQLAYKNSKGEIIPVQDSAIDGDDVIDVTISDDIATLNAERDTVTTVKSGSLSITFWAKTGSATTKKFIKEYNVQVQDVFKNTIPPSLNSVSVSTTANKNALFTLPVATATDSYESKVFVDVKVTDPDGKPVLQYTPNDYGYAERPADESGLKAVAFDNNEVKSFYPVKEGAYKVQYTAITGSADDRQTSIVHEHIVECRDRLAPQIVEIASDKIPTKWGLDSVSYGEYATPDADPVAKARGNTQFELPFPKFADNADDNTKLTLTISVINPANRTLARWEGLVSEYLADGVELYSPAIHNEYLNDSNKDKKFVLSGDDTTGKFMPFSFNIFAFDAANSKISADTEKFGDWTIKYSVKDSSGNGSSGSAVKSFKVNLSKNYTNLERPAINEDSLDIPRYILINDDNTSFTIPVIPMKSSDDLDLSFEYTMTSTVTLPAEPVKHDGITYTPVDTFDIKRESATSTIGGKEYPVQKIGGNHYVLISENNKDYAFMLSPQVEFTFTAYDDVGNDFGFVDCTTSKVTVDKVIIDLIYDGSFASTAFDVDFANFDPAAVAVMQGGDIEAGGFEIKNVERVEYTGFEISVVDADGDAVPLSAVTYNRKTSDTPVKHSIFVDDVRFTPKKVATGTDFYHLNVRVYDILGKSEVFSFAFQVTENPNYVGTTAAKIESTGTLKTEYELEKTYTIKNTNNENVIVRKIDNCLAFGIMNNVFVGLDSGTYRIHDYVVEGYANFDTFVATITDINTWDIALKNFHRQSYSVTVNNNEKPVIEIHDVFPRFIQNKTVTEDLEVYKKGQFVELPIITGFTKHENAEVTVKVTYDGATVEGGVKKIYIMDLAQPHDAESNRTFKSKNETGDVEYTFSGIFAFAATADGDYTVTITVSTSSGDETVTYTIKVGDRTSVSFTVEPVSTAKVNQKFKMTKPTIDGEFSTLTIELKDPNGNKVSTAGLSLSQDEFANFANYETSSYAFTDAGTYTVVYTVSNKNDETIKSTQTFKMDVTSKGGDGARAPVALTAVLIIVGVMLIAGVVVYVVRFRPVKK